MNNLVLITISLLILAFIGLLWLRHNLLSLMLDLQRREEILMKDFALRRDQVPLLLESIREQQEPTDLWRKLVTDRALFHTQTSLIDERNFEQELRDFIAAATLRSLSFLEAKKNIEDTGALIENQKHDIQTAVAEFNAKRKGFPYTMASAIFGFREQSAA